MKYWRHQLCLVAAIIVLRVPADEVRAETLLRWKLKPGETVRFEVQQHSDTETTGAGKPTAMSLDMAMQLTWQVTEVDAQGTISMTQTIDKLSVAIKVDKLEPLVYDSATRPAASGPAKEIADALSPLIGGVCAVKMTDRGEIASVEPSEPLRQAWAKTKAGNLLSPEGLSRVWRTCVFPEQSLAAEGTWVSSYVSPSPLGALRVSSKYQLNGTETQGGVPCEAIKVTTALELAAAVEKESPATKLVENDQSGQLYFDNAAGRMRFSRLQQRLTTERPYREMTIRVRTSTSMEMKLVGP